jgi:selenide,water dikinase
VPVLAAARRYVGEGMAPGGTHANWRFLADWTTWAEDLTKDEQLLLADAQTSGGLLIAVAPERVDALVRELEARQAPCAAIVGEIIAGPAGHMEVTRR